MEFPFSFQLQRPRYAFSEDATRTHVDRHRGLLTYAPLREAPITEPNILFIFVEEDRDHGNQLYLALRNGIAKFPGCKQLIGVHLEKNNVEPVRVSPHEREHIGQAFYRTIIERLERDSKPDFAFIIHSKQPRSFLDDPYPAAKAALARYGVPSQYVSWELLNSSQQFRFAISNVALNFFVKLGGLPWSVSLQRREPTLVFGIGRATIQNPENRSASKLAGFATCVLSNGVYVNTSFFPPVETEKELHATLAAGVSEALQTVLKDNSTIKKITLHVSRFEKKEVPQVLARAIAEYEREQSIPIPFDIVRLTENSDFAVLDLDDPGYVSTEGTVIGLGRRHALLVTEGRRERDVWRGRKPVNLELQREYASNPGLSMKECVEDAFFLSSVNWRGFNAMNQPITLLYARWLAELIGKMSIVDPDIGVVLQEQSKLHSVPWFI